jgi:hypothetical protein
MIPIVSIFNLTSALFFFGVSLRVYFSYRKSQDQSLKYFFYSFFFLGVTVFLLSTDGLIFKDKMIMGLMHAIDPFFAILALVFIGVIPLRLMGKEKLKNIFFWIFIAIAIVVLLVDLLNWKPVNVYPQGSFIYWGDARGLVINAMLGIISGLTLLLVIVFFLINGLKASQKLVKIRAFFIAAGLLVIAVMSVLNYIVGPMSRLLYAIRLLCTILNVIAGILILFGIYYKPRDYDAIADRVN